MMFRAVPFNSKKEVLEDDKTLLKRTELPVYSEAPSKSFKSDDEISNEFIYNSVKLLRTEGCKLARTAQSVSDRCSKFYNTGVAHAQTNFASTIDYLHEERNLLPRIGAVGGGVLFGYILAFRKGFFKRLLYSTAGGIAAGALCYPNEAEEYFKKSTQLSKTYLIISYHFLNGVVKDFGGFELPAFPWKPLSQDSKDPNKE